MCHKRFAISIRAPKEGSDEIVSPKQPVKIISIRAPKEGSDEFFVCRLSELVYFNPRSQRRERRYLYNGTTANAEISIRAPKEGSDVQTLKVKR